MRPLCCKRLEQIGKMYSKKTAWQAQVKRCFCVCFVASLLLFSVWAHAASNTAEPGLRMHYFRMDPKPHGMTINTKLQLTNSAQVADAMRDGAQLVFDFQLILEEVRTFLSNQELATQGRMAHIKYDPLLDEFLLHEDGAPLLRHNDIDMLFRQFWERAFAPFTLQAALVKDETYRVHVQCTLRHSQVPPWLKSTLFFWSWDITPPLVFEQDVTY